MSTNNLENYQNENSLNDKDINSKISNNKNSIADVKINFTDSFLPNIASFQTKIYLKVKENENTLNEYMN